MRLAAALVGFNRPYYFLPTLRSILQNRAIQQCDLWVFLDGGRGHAQDIHTEILRDELSRSDHQPRHVEIVRRQANFDCGRNLIDARRRLFDHESYDQVFVFEDDMVVGPHYLELCLRLLHWSQLHFSDVGVVQGYHACWMSKAEKAARLDEVTTGNPHWWGYLMPKTTWTAIAPILYRYEHDFLCGHAYRQRDIALIGRWTRDLIHRQATESPNEGDEPLLPRYPTQWDYRAYVASDRSGGQDATTAIAIELAGLKKLATTVNRGLPIGRRGIHFTEQAFRNKRLHEMRLDSFPSDRFRSTFRPGMPEEARLVPYMRSDEMETMRTLIHERKPRRVLEFGAGGSTITFSSEPEIEQWWSLENKQEWIVRVLQNCDSLASAKTTLLRTDASQLECQLQELLQTQQFDMFFVDGFDRPSILRQLHPHLCKHNGFVVVHDYARHAYTDAIELYSERRVLAPPSAKAQGLILLEANRP